MLPGETTNADHIPPRQTLTPELRKKYEPVRLVTRRVHSACNSSYELDERYFVQCLVPFLKDGNEPASALYRKTIEEYHAGKNVSLVERIKGQWTDRVGGIHLPASTMAYQLEGDRFYRVAEKIVRGLHYVETEQVLDPNIHMVWSITLPKSKPPEHFELFMLDEQAKASKGNHQGVFAYRHMAADPGWNYWAMLFWDQILLTAIFPLGAGFPAIEGAS